MINSEWSPLCSVKDYEISITTYITLVDEKQRLHMEVRWQEITWIVIFKRWKQLDGYQKLKMITFQRYVTVVVLSACGGQGFMGARHEHTVWTKWRQQGVVTRSTNKMSLITDHSVQLTKKVLIISTVIWRYKLFDISNCCW